MKKYGLGHVFVFNGTAVTTPDGGTTAALLGLALTGLAALRPNLDGTDFVRLVLIKAQSECSAPF